MTGVLHRKDDLSAGTTPWKARLTRDLLPIEQVRRPKSQVIAGLSTRCGTRTRAPWTMTAAVRRRPKAAASAVSALPRPEPLSASCMAPARAGPSKSC